MLTQSLVLAFLSSLALAVPLFAWSGDLRLTVQFASFCWTIALAYGCKQQYHVMLAHRRREEAPLAFRARAPMIEQPQTPQNNTNTLLEQPVHTSRSVVFNANGQTSQLSLEPASSRLVDFLSTCIRISSADKFVFPTVRDLKRIGLPYEEYDAMLALLGDAVDRDKRPATTRNGVTLGQLRDMALGKDVVRR